MGRIARKNSHKLDHTCRRKVAVRRRRVPNAILRSEPLWLLEHEQREVREAEVAVASAWESFVESDEPALASCAERAQESWVDDAWSRLQSRVERNHAWRVRREL